MHFGAEVVDGGTWFRVWAPRPRTLELEVAGRRLAVPRGTDGWAELFVPGVGDGARYSYVLDGERRRPDPASRAQPDGVHGPSQVTDPRRWRWRDEAFVQPPLDAIYELHVGTFSPSSDFAGVAAGLERVRAAGFRAVEILPVGSFPGRRNWGYDGVSWLAPQASYGGPDGLRALVDECHAQGIAVILDVVFNHLGPDGNYLAEFGPYFRDAHTPWGQALDLDGPASGHVRGFILGVARALVAEYHLDGLRLDAVHAFVDASPQHLCAELAAALHGDGVRRGRPVWVIAESDLGRASVVEPPEDGGWGCDAMWADDFHHALHAVVAGERKGYYADFGSQVQLARALERGFVHTGRRTPFRGRPFGEPAAHLDGRRFVACAQNHDQVGNRALGERLAALAPGCEHAVAATLLGAPFLPMIFMGEEHGETAPFLYFTAFDDPQLARAVTDGRRREYGEGAPDPQALETFERSRLRPEKFGARGDALRRWYRALLDLRRARASLGCGSLGRTEAVAEGASIVLRRLGTHEETLVAVRLAPTPATVALPMPRHGRWQILLDAARFAGPRGVHLDGDTITLPAWGAIVLGAP